MRSASNEETDGDFVNGVFFKLDTQTREVRGAISFWKRKRFLGQLYAVKTDSSGLVGICDQQHDATALHSIDPAMTMLSPSLPALTTVTPGSKVRIRAQTTPVIKDDKCPAN